MSHPHSLEAESHLQRRQWRSSWQRCVLAMVMAVIAKPYVMLTSFLPVWTVSRVSSLHLLHQDMSEHESPLILTIPVLLHRQSGVHIYVGSQSIEKELLRSKLLVNPTHISGRTMLRLAKDVICNCKKMQALVTRSNSLYKDINYTPAGTNYEDYVKWCLSAMYKNEQSSGESEETKQGM